MHRERRINARLCHSASVGCEALYDAGKLGAESILDLREVQLPKARRIRKDVDLDDPSGPHRLPALTVKPMTACGRPSGSQLMIPGIPFTSANRAD